MEEVGLCEGGTVTGKQAEHGDTTAQWIEPIPDTFDNIVRAIATTPASNTATPPGKAAVPAEREPQSTERTPSS